jgi:hypothetical protein
MQKKFIPVIIAGSFLVFTSCKTGQEKPVAAEKADAAWITEMTISELQAGYSEKK